MRLPFTADQFFLVFEKYNEAIWPAHLAAYVAASGVLLLILLGYQKAGPIAGGVLGAFWLWQGAAYQIGYFSPINPAAYGFGVLMILEGLALLWSGVARREWVLRALPDLPGGLGAAFILYGMVLYPILGAFWGHRYPRAPVFGVAPCPTVIFTFGLLLWARHSAPRYLVVGPLLWAAVGTGAALSLGVYQDYALPVAAVIAAPMILLPTRRRARTVASLK